MFTDLVCEFGGSDHFKQQMNKPRDTNHSFLQ